MSSANTVGNEYKGHLTHSSFEDVFFVFTRNYRFYLNCIVPLQLISRKEIDSHGNN